ncbi:MAG: glycosyltransferase [Parcubacteria group bacterium CG10_big_fil_rev_8_21_14_0_10_36_14]|nr:MAG: glycosyltransferase [Parcubacteria group bacterium CG10_big_fil_rev_8_21_14_0_10_36_14]
MKILGVRIDEMGEKEVLEKCKSAITEGRRLFITTPNPEILLLANKDEDFKKILNSADINIPDGVGLKLGAKIKRKKLNYHLTGTDLMGHLAKMAEEMGLGIYLLGAEQGIARKAGQNLKKILPSLNIIGAESGGKFESWDNRVIIEHINAVKPDILFIALGQGKQERWIFANLPNLKSIKIVIGVGGAFDFYSGRIPRAPKWMRQLGLEWLYRLSREPSRWKRIFNAVIVFPIVCLIKK